MKSSLAVANDFVELADSRVPTEAPETDLFAGIRS